MTSTLDLNLNNVIGIKSLVVFIIFMFMLYTTLNSCLCDCVFVCRPFVMTVTTTMVSNHVEFSVMMLQVSLMAS